MDYGECFAPSVKNYLDYVLNQQNEYISFAIYHKKGMEFTIRITD